jgi:hypothetical protein
MENGILSSLFSPEGLGTASRREPGFRGNLRDDRDKLRRALDWVQGQDEILFSRTSAARELWNDRYDALSRGREDAYGAATSPLIDACHLHAALAVWDWRTDSTSALVRFGCGLKMN